MELILNHHFLQGEGVTCLGQLTAEVQQKLTADLREVSALTSRLICKEHANALVPVITDFRTGRIRHTFFVCCQGFKQILEQTLPYSASPFQVIAWPEKSCLPVHSPPLK